MTTTDIEALVEAALNRLQVSLNYTKATTGEIVNHKGGIVEIRSSEGILYLWDTTLNDHIRKFILANINSFQVLPEKFDYMSAGGYPIVINGQTYPEPV